MDERRQFLRRRTLLSGRVEFLNRSIFDCVVRDLSDGGARMRFDQQIAVPDIFELVIEKRNEKRTARAVWRNRDEIGVRFVEAENLGNVLAFQPRPTRQ